MDDSHGLDRFVTVQSVNYGQAKAEIEEGRKRSHWMWYVFPQIHGLGSSAMAERYALKTQAEAEAYLAHPVLGPRLLECAEALLQIPGKSANEIFGSPDDMKLKSSATLFACISPAGSAFDRLLDEFFQGERDARTLSILEADREKANRAEI